MTGRPRYAPHPDDQAALETLVGEFVAWREDRGVTQRGLAEALGVAHASVYSLERRRPANPLTRTLQVYAEPLELRLRLDITGLPELVTPAADALRAGGFLGTATVAHLRHVRTHLGLTRAAIEHETGWRWSSLAAFENTDREPLLSMLQRYTRALGGQLVPSWEEAC